MSTPHSSSRSISSTSRAREKERIPVCPLMYRLHATPLKTNMQDNVEPSDTENYIVLVISKPSA